MPKKTLDSETQTSAIAGQDGRRVVVPPPSRVVPLHTAVSGVAAPPGLTYQGGPLLSNVQVSVVFWGSGWQQPAQAALIPQVNNFFDYILTSSLMDLLAQYGVPGKPIGYGHRVSSSVQTGTQPGGGTGQVTDAQIQQAIRIWINSGAVPAPNANSLYFVYLPPGVAAIDPQGDHSCTQMCGYHWFIANTNPQIYYAVMPFPGCGGCLGSLSTMQALTSTSSHELCEAITDPQPWSGWNDNVNGEIGDICAWQTTTLGGFTIQKEWSNGQHTCAIAGLGSPTNMYVPVYAQGDPGHGIGGYDLKSPADRAFAFDYDGSGKLDHLALYRPGTGTMWILKNTGGNFSPVYHQGDPGNGIGGYDLKSPADLAFAFDYDHSGKLDHLALYRPHTGTMWILKNSGGNFSPVYHQGDPGNGIGGYDLKSFADRAFAFDYDHSGRLDHIALYRPGTGTMWILKNTGGNFSPVYHQGDPGNGIGGYDLKSPADIAFAFDYESSGRLDYMALYRPHTGTMWILKNTGGNFSPVYHQGDPGLGIGGYDLRSPADRAFAFDFDQSGKKDHIALYRPGTGTLWILKNTNGNFAPVYHQGDPGLGIGGYDLKSPADQVMAFDYDSSGKLDHLALYRPGTGTMWILRKN